MALTQSAHKLIKQHIDMNEIKPSLAIDATCGNGHDTLFLCQLGFTEVVAFDIQPSAIEATANRLDKEGYHAKLILAGHETMQHHVSDKAQIVIFNLGYLPGTDKQITSSAATTIVALDVALCLLDKKGLISILCYPGHTEGKDETDEVRTWLSSLGKDWQVTTIIETHKEHAPVLYQLSQV